MPKNCVCRRPGHFAVRRVSNRPGAGSCQVDLLSFFRARQLRKFASMIANSVRLSEVLRQMEEGKERFTIRFVRADRKRKTGGQIEEWHNCRLSKRRARGAQRSPMAGEAPARMPAHFQNATRNIMQGNSSQVRKVHIWLILAFNGQRVVLG
jgi:hypothetical protein